MMKRHEIILLIVGTVLILATASESGAAEKDGGVLLWDPTSWGHDYIDDVRDVGLGVSVAIDPDTDETYISYYDRDNGDLWLARTGAPTGNCGPFNTWDCKVVDSAGDVGKSSSIAVGGFGRMATLYISYYDEGNGSLKVLEGTVDRATGVLSYAIETIQSGTPGSSIFVGTRTALAIDDAGYAHIAYRVEYSRSQAIKYAKRVAAGTGNCGAGAPAGAWECSNVHLGVGIGEYLDIDTDPTGVPSIAFYDAHGTETYPMVAARVPSGGSCNLSDVWDCDAVQWPGHDIGKLVSIAVAEYQTYLAFYDETLQFLIYAKWPGFYTNCGSYDCHEVWPMGPDISQSAIDIALQSSSTPVIVYQHVGASSTDLMIARETDSNQNCVAGWMGGYGWRCETLTEGDATHFQAVGGLSIAMNAFGEATVANREVYRPPFSWGEGRLELAVAPRADRTPDPFVFADQTGAPLSTVVTSDPIIVSGIDDWSSISIVACTGAPCEYSVNGGAWYDETRWVNDGDSVEVRLTSAPTHGTAADLTLNIGRVFDGTRDTFTVTSLVQHTLSVALAGDGDGSVTSAPAGIDCPSSTCSALFDETETVVLSPVASAGSHFSGWSGDADCADGSVDTDTDVSCVATFLLDTHNLAISKTGSGTGTVVSVPAGINCGTTCVASFDTGILVTLIPSADGGSHFSGWSGDDGCDDGIVAMDTDVSCTAAFDVDDQTLTVNRTGTGSGDVVSVPAGIDCGATCTAPFAYGTTVTLTPTPDAGSVFVGFSGDADCADGIVTMNADVTCTAGFDVDAHTLSVAKTGTGSGSVVSTPSGIDCGATCAAQFEHGIEVTLIPTPDTGSTFVGFSGHADCADGVVAMQTDIDCTAGFSPTTDLIFVDGFESGNMSLWSSVVP